MIRARKHHERPRRRPALAPLLAIVGFAAMASACASTSRHHLAITNYADRTLMPENRAAGWALTPVLIPLTVGTLTLDNLIVAPVVHLPSAVDHARGFYRLEIEGYYSHAALTPFQIALTPVIFTGSWLGRIFFAVEPNPHALWGWPEWGRQWRRDEEGRLLGPPDAVELEDDAQDRIQSSDTDEATP